MNRIVEIHALQHFAPSNLNRDDTGAPKDALFGGTRRARISSQCIKRAVRQHALACTAEQGLTAEDYAHRTKRLLLRLVERLVEKGHPADQAETKARAALAGIGITIKEDGKSEYLLFLGQREISAIASFIDEHWDAIRTTEAGEGKEKPAKRKKGDAASGDALPPGMKDALNGGKALDIALYGRMLADMPDKNQDAACQVAHAISTHAVDREFDFYTAVDDLLPEDTAGADMMGTIEFNSACYYRYAVIDMDKLSGNLQKDDTLSLAGVRSFLEGFVVAEPTGKQNTFAAHNPPDFVAVTIRRNAAPRSLATAFETAIRARSGESLTAKSVEALVAKWAQLRDAYGGDERTFVLNLTGANAGLLGEAVSSLKDLLDRTQAAVRE